MSTTPIAYRIFWDTAYAETHAKRQDEIDATLVRFPGWENIAGWMSTRAYDVPGTILFEASFEVSRHADYPCTDVSWPLMSQHMLDALHAAGNMPHRVIPVRFIDRSVRPEARIDASGALRPEVVDDRFSAIQLLEHLDVVDWGRSEFTRSRLNPKRVRHFSRLVLAPPSGGFPPLFRLEAERSNLYVSAAAHDALTGAGIRGVTFQPVFAA